MALFLLSLSTGRMFLLMPFPLSSSLRNHCFCPNNTTWVRYLRPEQECVVTWVLRATTWKLQLTQFLHLCRASLAALHNVWGIWLKTWSSVCKAGLGSPHTSYRCSFMQTDSHADGQTPAAMFLQHLLEYPAAVCLSVQVSSIADASLA